MIYEYTLHCFSDNNPSKNSNGIDPLTIYYIIQKCKISVYSASIKWKQTPVILPATVCKRVGATKSLLHVNLLLLHVSNYEHLTLRQANFTSLNWIPFLPFITTLINW